MRATNRFEGFMVQGDTAAWGDDGALIATGGDKSDDALVDDTRDDDGCEDPDVDDLPGDDEIDEDEWPSERELSAREAYVEAVAGTVEIALAPVLGVKHAHAATPVFACFGYLRWGEQDAQYLVARSRERYFMEPRYKNWSDVQQQIAAGAARTSTVGGQLLARPIATELFIRLDDTARRPGDGASSEGPLAQWVAHVMSTYGQDYFDRLQSMSELELRTRTCRAAWQLFLQSRVLTLDGLRARLPGHREGRLNRRERLLHYNANDVLLFPELCDLSTDALGELKHLYDASHVPDTARRMKRPQERDPSGQSRVRGLKVINDLVTGTQTIIRPNFGREDVQPPPSEMLPADPMHSDPVEILDTRGATSEATRLAGIRSAVSSNAERAEKFQEDRAFELVIRLRTIRDEWFGSNKPIKLGRAIILDAVASDGKVDVNKARADARTYNVRLPATVGALDTARNRAAVARQRELKPFGYVRGAILRSAVVRLGARHELVPEVTLVDALTEQQRAMLGAESAGQGMRGIVESAGITWPEEISPPEAWACVEDAVGKLVAAHKAVRVVFTHHGGTRKFKFLYERDLSDMREDLPPQLEHLKYFEPTGLPGDRTGEANGVIEKGVVISLPDWAVRVDASLLHGRSRPGVGPEDIDRTTALLLRSTHGDWWFIPTDGASDA